MERREVSQSGPGIWTVDLVRLPSVGYVKAAWRHHPQWGDMRWQQAPSGLTLLHFDSPRLDRSGSLHLGGSRGGLLQLHGSQAGFLIHSFCL